MVARPDIDSQLGLCAGHGVHMLTIAENFRILIKLRMKVCFSAYYSGGRTMNLQKTISS